MPTVPHSPLSAEQIEVFQTFLDEMGTLDAGQVSNVTVTQDIELGDMAHIEAAVLFVVPKERADQLMDDIWAASPRNPLNMSGDSDGTHTHFHTHFDPAAINRQDLMG